MTAPRSVTVVLIVAVMTAASNAAACSDDDSSGDSDAFCAAAEAAVADLAEGRLTLDDTVTVPVLERLQADVPDGLADDYAIVLEARRAGARVRGPGVRAEEVLALGGAVEAASGGPSDRVADAFSDCDIELPPLPRP